MARSAVFETKIDSARNTLLERGYLQSRLQDLFFSVQRDRLHPIYTQHFPDEKKTSLIAVFDNGIDPDPIFSGVVLGRIFLDEQRNLSLIIWPLEGNEKKHPWRKEILLSHIDDFRFELLDPSGTELVWSDEWPKNRQGIPSMVRLFISQNGLSLPFAFFFSSFEPLITYTETNSKIGFCRRRTATEFEPACTPPQKRCVFGGPGAKLFKFSCNGLPQKMMHFRGPQAFGASFADSNSGRLLGIFPTFEFIPVYHQ